MSVLQVIKWPNKILETPCQPVKSFDDELKQLINNMIDTMQHYHGIGLAANQVGIDKSLFVIHIPSTKNDSPQPWHDKTLIFINPKITKMQGKTKFQEGCLSFPNIYEYVQRAQEVWIEAQDETGKPFNLHATDLLSICIQHEYDHTQGIIFLDRMSRLKSRLIKKQILKLAMYDFKIDEHDKNKYTKT